MGEIEGLRGEVAELRRELKLIREENAQLQTENTTLREENGALRKALDESRRAGKRQAGPFSRNNPKPNPRKTDLMLRVLLFSLAVASVAQFAIAQAETELEPFLLPVFSADIPGAHSSLWRTELAILNAGASAVSVKPLECRFVCGGVISYAPGRSERITPLLNAGPGRLLWVEKARMGDVRVSLRVRDLSRQESSAGVDIPVVRRAQTAPGALALLNIPTSLGFRHSLRIYDMADHNSTTVRVRIYPFPADAVAAALDDFVVTLNDDPLARVRPYRDIPAQLTLNNLFDDRPALRTFEAVTVQIDPLGSEAEIWAFVAIINNSTQEFTIITP